MNSNHGNADLDSLPISGSAFTSLPGLQRRL